MAMYNSVLDWSSVDDGADREQRRHPSHPNQYLRLVR